MMTKKFKPSHSLVVYQSKNGALELRTDTDNETVWLTQDQLAALFDVQKAAISKHFKNIFKSHELKKSSVVSILETTAKDGKTYKVAHYNLDATLSLGYRLNSKQASLFRQWATKTLRKHMLEGYTINRHRIESNYQGFLKAVQDVKSLLPSNSSVDNGSIIELITMFADTWMSLNAYDKDEIYPQGQTKRKVALTV